MKKLLLALSVIFCIQTTIVAQIDTNVVVYFWKLDESFANRNRARVDTALDFFQQNNPIHRNFTGAQTLGNYGLPAQSIVFTERPQNDEFILINNFFPFMLLYNSTIYVNTKKPFTNLSYMKGGSNQTKEEILDVFHSQNLTKTLNLGFHYKTVGSLGQYSFQKVKNNAFNFFSSFSGKLYSYHFSLNWNKIMADENGGVLKDSYITDTTYAKTKDIPVLFSGTENSSEHNPDVLNEIKNLNILTVQEIAFRGKSGSTDSTAAVRKINIFYPKLVYIFNMNRTVRLFTDLDPKVGFNNGLYPAMYVSDSITSDSLLYWKFFNALRLQFQGRRNNHYFVDYSYEMSNYSMSVTTGNSVNDTLENIWFITDKIKLPGLNYNSRLYNTYFSSGFSKIFANRFDVNLYGRYYVSGYRSGDFLISGDMKFIFGKLDQPVSFMVQGSNELKTPDFLYTRYASNNFIWTKNFSKTSKYHLSTILSISSKKFELQGDYYLLRSWVFMNEEAVPAQYKNPLSVFVLKATKQFDFWKITSLNRLVYQKSENENIIDLPEIAFYNSTYLKHLFNFRATGGKLLAMLGFDLYYNSLYYAEAYMPSLNSFYRQNEKQLGNYPYFDVYLNLQLKRFKFFLKVEHVNAGWINNNNNYFSVLHYPRNGRDLKFGLSWNFYD